MLRVTIIQDHKKEERKLQNCSLVLACRHRPDVETMSALVPAWPGAAHHLSSELTVELLA